MARALGQDRDAAELAAAAPPLRQAINTVLFNPETGFYGMLPLDAFEGG